MIYSNLFAIFIIFTVLVFNIAMHFLRKITKLKWTQLTGAVMYEAFSKTFAANFNNGDYKRWIKYRLFIILALVGWVLGFGNGILSALFKN